ncbi:MAG: (Fe-S)-binding protein, partial [Candidatus Lokiarchaeota archaeon]|nr:(Fe-S)-binding protein [Candidatus Lokiarchaeota archaeon]
KEDAKAEMAKMIDGKESRVLSECITCFACDEYCPYNSHPFDLITVLQEKYNSLGVNPHLLKATVERYKPHDELRLKDIDPSKPVLNKCAFVKSNAENMEGKIFEDLQYVSGLSFFCNLLYHHYGRDSIIRERAPIIIENIKKQGIKEMICFHDECYGFYASYCPRNNIELPEDFKVIHIYEYLYDFLKDHESEITPLNMKIAYQRSCSNRFMPEIDEYVDKICDLIGIERVSREYDRENALCCAGVLGLLGRKKLMREAQNKNIKDMLDHNAEAVAYCCPMCLESIGSKAGRKGLKNYLLSDLCRLAIGESID